MTPANPKKQAGRPASGQKKTTTRGDPPFVMRMPPELRARINDAALANYRSASKEVICRLSVSFENESIDEHGVIVVHSPKPLK